MGDWGFDATYVSHFGLDAEVIRLPSMEHLEQFITGGIPGITAQAFDGAGITSASWQTAGRLRAITGFTEDGDVSVNNSGQPVRPPSPPDRRHST
jgi:hypothetical protein